MEKLIKINEKSAKRHLNKGLTIGQVDNKAVGYISDIEVDINDIK
ncbi:11458_t:CDS:2, partial [Racocetra persica]